MKGVKLLILFLLPGYLLPAQRLKDITVGPADNGKVLSTFLEQAERENQVDFIFSSDRLTAFTVTGIDHEVRLLDYLRDSFSPLLVIPVGDRVAFIVDKSVVAGDDAWDYVVFDNDQASNDIHLTGNVRDGLNKDAVPGAQIYVPALKVGTSTDSNGQFALDLPKSFFAVTITSAGYATHSYLVGFSSLAEGDRFNVVLYPSSTELEIVTVTAERTDANVSLNNPGVARLDIGTIKTMPAFMGEVDPVRSLTTLPGVSTAGELNSGFNVRGGDSGQNLILQDGAPIYNPSHLFGFFSAFNPDLVSNVVLYKGGGPASFGGRVASTLDVQLKNGDAGTRSISGSIGPISSRLTVEGPIIRNKSSYIASGRLSYSNWLVHSVKSAELKNSTAHFDDFTAKVFNTLNANNLVSFSVYSSSDNFKIASDSAFAWSTLNLSLAWSHTFNDRLSSFTSIYKSHYQSGVDNLDELTAFRYLNSINNTGLRYHLDYTIDDNLRFSTGLESVATRIDPGTLTPSSSDENIPYQHMNDQHSLESAAFLQADFKLLRLLRISAGLRYSNFLRLGPDDIYSFDYSVVRNRYPVISDTLHFSSNRVIREFGNLEPRLSLRYSIDSATSVKAGYSRTAQYQHLISNTTTTTPQDYWVSSGPDLVPELGNQYSLGVFRNFSGNQYQCSIEGFYKTIQNDVDYIDGADLTLNPSLEAGLLQGKGLAYGAEFLLKKNVSPHLYGWLSYTYSRSLRKFKPENESGSLVTGDYYASSFDKPHDLSLVLNYKPGKYAVFSANFSYATGRPLTIPVSKFNYYTQLAVLNFSARNKYRIPDYHRLDLSVTISGRQNKRRGIQSEWTFSIFNVYGRKNAYSIYFDRFGLAHKISILGTVFPSFSYSFKI